MVAPCFLSGLPGPLPELPWHALEFSLLLLGVLFKNVEMRVSSLLVLESFCSGFGVGASGGECLDLLGVLLDLLLVVDGVSAMLLYVENLR